MRTFGRILIVVLLLGAIGGIGYGVWNSGYQQGLMETVETTADVVVTAPYYPGYYGFGVFGLMFKIFFAFILFGLLFKIFFGRRYWCHHTGEAHDHYRSRMESRMSRWHDEAHGREAGAEPDTS
ncbi:MAG: hypothetical protein U9N56_06795 [Actinomycetota bacterium]|nr:hypothetical protein [Actinomycetota bacterium]